MAAGLLAALSIAMITSLWTAAHPVFADVHRLEIQSDSLVGAVPGAELAPAVRLDPPAPADTVAAAATPDAPVASAPVAPIVNKSNCRGDLAGAVMTIEIADISYSCPVYAGGQTMLNSGAVTQITDDAIASVLAAYPGGPGVLWIAAHRSSHGGAFAAVPNLADGALVTMSDGTHTATYRIVGRIYATIKNDRVVDSTGHATGAATLDSIIRPDHGGLGASRLLLQTCDGDDHRWMIYADLVTG
ncbi:MAG TPA: sortase [Ilumatobacteraceae bacterium]|nr:sortase [Ilumatobacteraceae bacterium]